MSELTEWLVETQTTNRVFELSSKIRAGRLSTFASAEDGTSCRCGEPPGRVVSSASTGVEAS
jgi:hypothetical protein